MLTTSDLSTKLSSDHSSQFDAFYIANPLRLLSLPQELTNLIQLIQKRMRPDAEPYRLLHGRGKTFSGYEFLNIDHFGSILVVMLHEARDLAWKDALAKALLSSSIQGLVIQDRSLRPSQNHIYGDVPEKHLCHGESLTYELSPRNIKNPGWFLDSRVARRWTKDHAKGCKVLNLFSYTCGFSTMALKGGANSVVNMDMNASVLQRGRENHKLNELSLTSVKFLKHDVLKSFGKISKLGPYDMVIVDPPSIQSGSFQLRRDYPKILKRLRGWLHKDGRALLICNDPMVSKKDFESWILERVGTYNSLEALPQPEDYPEQDLERALKAYILS